MLRKTLLASCLLIASGSALAFDDFASRHGVSITPRLSITFGGGHYDGYHNDGYRPYVYVPHRVYPAPVYYRDHHRGHGRYQGGYHRDDWDGSDRHDRRRHGGHRGHD